MFTDFTRASYKKAVKIVENCTFSTIDFSVRDDRLSTLATPAYEIDFSDFYGLREVQGNRKKPGDRVSLG